MSEAGRELFKEQMSYTKVMSVSEEGLREVLKVAVV